MKRGLFFLLACVLFFFAAHAFAQPGCTTCDRSQAPRLWIPDGDPSIDRLPLKSSQADIVIEGPIARVTVTQRYGNAGKRPIHARYVFPGSTRAAVQGLTMKIGGRSIRAKIQEKEQARQQFEAAKQAGQHAALLDQQRPNVFMMDVANILPGEEVELTLEYSELLVPEQGVYELVYPTVVGPRYGGDPVRAAPDAPWLVNPYADNAADGSNAARVETGIRVRLASPLPVSDLRSVQHQIEARWLNEQRVDLTLADTERDAGNRDFILRFRLQGTQINTGLMTYDWNGEQYFLAMVQPPRRVETAQVMQREYLFVVDVSGSMHGFPLDTAREVMRELLGQLRPEERFNILFFSGGANVLSPTPLAANLANLQRALDMMSRIQASGGTELVSALEQAFQMPRTPNTARSIVVVTDGYISAERQAYELIRQNLNETNLFAFGIGSSVNRHLIESMARAGAGEPFVITDAQEVAGVGERLRRYVASPVLGQIRLQGQGVELYDMEPAEIPVMLAERPIVVFGKYRHAQPGATLALSGISAAGDYRASLPLASDAAPDSGELLPVLWARQRVQRLSEAPAVGAEPGETRAQIVELGLRHALLTPYTSFVAVDETVVNPNGQADAVQQALPLPQGVSALSLARPVPEPELVWLLLLLAAWFASARGWQHRQALVQTLMSHRRPGSAHEWTDPRV